MKTENIGILVFCSNIDHIWSGPARKPLLLNLAVMDHIITEKLATVKNTVSDLRKLENFSVVWTYW